MGNQPLPEKILQDSFDTPEGQQQFRKDMAEFGFSVIRLNDETMDKLKVYLESTATFFKESSEVKALLSANEEMKKKNEGYLVVDGIKEFLKLKPTDESKQKFPNIPSFSDHYRDCQQSLFPLCQTALKHLATDIMADGSQYMAEPFHQEVQKRMKERSSLTVINYFPRLPPSERGEEPCKSDGDNGLFVPSSVHTDTGILTLISCSEVSGLQVQPKGTEDFIEVEKKFDPRRDMFLVLGQKIEIFAQNGKVKPKYQPCVHRVHLPYKTPRKSILLFADVPV